MCSVIHVDRSTRSVLYRLQMSMVDKLRYFVNLLIITVAAYLLLLYYFRFTNNVGIPQHVEASVQNLDDSEAGILNPGCILRELRDYLYN